MKNYECIFLDRDGTINHDPGYISQLEDFKLFDFTISALRLLKSISNKFIIITNQSGIGRRLIKEIDLLGINNFLMNEFANNDIPLLKIYYCPDHPDQASDRRKPGVGMFIESSKDYSIDLSNCLMIGDSISDIQPAKNLGMDSMLVLTGNGERDKNKFVNDNKPTYVAQNIMTGAKLLTQ